MTPEYATNGMICCWYEITFGSVNSANPQSFKVALLSSMSVSKILKDGLVWLKQVPVVELPRVLQLLKLLQPL